MFVSPKVLYDSYISIIPVRVSHNDCGKAVTKIRIIRETLHSRDFKLGTVPYSYSRNWKLRGSLQEFLFSVMEPYLPVRSEESGETGWSHQIALWRGCFFRDAVGSLTRAFSLHEMQIYWNKRKGLQKKGHSGPLAEISLSAQLLI